MKLLLLDRPKEPSITGKRDVEFFGPWAQPINFPEELVCPRFIPYPEADSVYRAESRAREASLALLNRLTEIMPGLTGVNEGARFWRTLLGYYVFFLAGFAEDIKTRYLSLPEKEYILGLPLIEYNSAVPSLWDQASSLLTDDCGFHLHALSLFLRQYYPRQESIEYANISPRWIDNRLRQFYTKISFINHRRVFRKLSHLFGGRMHKGELFRGSSSITSLIWDDYNMEDFDFRGLEPAGLLALHALNREKIIMPEMDLEKRRILKGSFPPFYGELLSLALPVIALEGLGICLELFKKKIPFIRRVERIYTHGQAFNGPGLDRLLFALLAENGSKIICVQHGCGSAYQVNSAVSAERELADEYIYWGKGYLKNGEARQPLDRSYRHLPSIYLSHLCRKNTLKSTRKRWDALMVVLEESRFVKWLYNPIFPDMAQDYFSRQKVLFNGFSQSKRTAVKIYPEAFGWGQYEWLKAKYRGFDLFSSGRFVDYSLYAKIVVLDYNGTSFLEMLAMNRPFLATWNRRWFRGGGLFENFIDRLKEAGVFYEQPEELVAACKRIISSDTPVWWHEFQRQKVLREMADNFAMTSTDIRTDWIEEFKRGDR